MRFAVATFALLLFAPTFSVPAPAQSNGGSSSKGTYLSISSQILSDKKLFKELNLSKEQILDLKDMKLKFIQGHRKVFLQRPVFVPDAKLRAKNTLEREAKIRTVSRPYEEKLAKLLNETQIKRLAEIHLQFRMVNRPLQALGHIDQLARELKLTERQLKKLRKLNEERLVSPRRSNILDAVQAGMKQLSKEQKKKLQQLQGVKYPVRTLGFRPERFIRGMLKRLDTNKDGNVTKEESKFFWRTYKRYDANKNDVLEKNEIDKALAEQLRRANEYNKKFDKAIGRK